MPIIIVLLPNSYHHGTPDLAVLAADPNMIEQSGTDKRDMTDSLSFITSAMERSRSEPWQARRGTKQLPFDFVTALASSFEEFSFR